MAKDPAFLFYPGDWLGGTLGMTLEQKGCYLELLILQFNTGKFTEAQAKQVLSICFDVAWATLKQKFSTDGKFYWNNRLLEEKEKRQNFSNSRRNNALSPKNKKKHMHKHMEDENINENESINWDSIKTNFKNAYEWKEDFCRKKNTSMPDLEFRMTEFISDIELKQEFKSLKELKSHFTNLFNKQKNGSQLNQSSNGKLGTSAARIKAAGEF